MDTSVEIDQEAFLKALYDLVARLKEEGRHVMMSLLKPERSSLEHNRWTLVVNSEIAKKQIDMEREFVAEIREKINAPKLFLEVIVEEVARPEDSVPYTNSEKLELMRKKNPAVDLLLKKFDAILEY